MSAKLLIVALVCAVAYAQAGIISRESFSTQDCTGTATFGQNTTTNVCVSGVDVSSAWYFDASNVYMVEWFGIGCNGTVAEVSQYPVGCGSTLFGTRYSTSGTSEANPAGTFPPAGFTVSTVFVNNTVSISSKATTCTAGNGIVSYKTAANADYCAARPSNLFFTPSTTTKGACSADGTTSGTVVFKDTTCTAVAAGSSRAVTACDIDGNNAVSFSCGAAPVFPSDVPVQGFITYTNAACTLPANPTTYYVGPTCFDSQTLVCGTVNGTDGMASYNSWTPATGSANGACSGSDRGSQVVLAGTCVPFPAGSTTSFRKYFCASSGPGASASTASVSVLATLLAAVAAVFAVRSL